MLRENKNILQSIILIKGNSNYMHRSRLQNKFWERKRERERERDRERERERERERKQMNMHITNKEISA